MLFLLRNNARSFFPSFQISVRSLPFFLPHSFSLCAASAVKSSLSFPGDGVNSPFPFFSASLHVSLLILTLFPLLLLPNLPFTRWACWLRPYASEGGQIFGPWSGSTSISRFAVWADVWSLLILSSAPVVRLRVVGFTAAVGVSEICAACLIRVSIDL